MKIKIFSLLVLIPIATLLVSCDAGRKTRTSGLPLVCTDGQVEISGECVDPLPGQITYCTQVQVQSEAGTEDRLFGWGGLNVFRMLSESCYNDACACKHFQSTECEPWRLSAQDKLSYKIGFGALDVDNYCCPQDVMLDHGACLPVSSRPADCTGYLGYAFKFIKCDDDIYMLHAMSNAVKHASCADISNVALNPFKLGPEIAISQKGNYLFILTPEKNSSLVIESVAAMANPPSSAWFDVPSANNYAISFVMDCLESLADPESKTGAFCSLRNDRFGFDLDRMY